MERPTYTAGRRGERGTIPQGAMRKFVIFQPGWTCVRHFDFPQNFFLLAQVPYETLSLPVDRKIAGKPIRGVA